jgi:hypothetical protein
MQLFEAIRRTPRRATSPNWRTALCGFFDNRSKLRAHVISSHEHIDVSSVILLSSELGSTTSRTGGSKARDGLPNPRSMARCRSGRWPLPASTPPATVRRGGRAVDRAGLENRKAERPREFESHPLRFLNALSVGRCELLVESSPSCDLNSCSLPNRRLSKEENA